MRRLQVAQELDDLLLHRAVERAGRLVEHDHLRLQDHRPGDGDALALAAGELVRVAVAHVGLEARPRPAPRRRGGRARAAESSGSWIEQALGDDPPDGHARARASRTGPGTRAAARAASAASAPGRGRAAGRDRRSARRSAAAAGARGRGSTCPSPTRRRCRSSAPARRCRLDPVDRPHLVRRGEEPAAGRKVTLHVVAGHQLAARSAGGGGLVPSGSAASSIRV